MRIIQVPRETVPALIGLNTDKLQDTKLMTGSRITRPEVYSCAWVSTLPLSESLIQEIAKICPFMAKTWSSYGSSNWFFLNHNQCSQECSMPNFSFPGVSHSPLFLKLAKIWPFYGKNMVLQIGSF